MEKITLKGLGELARYFTQRLSRQALAKVFNVRGKLAIERVKLRTRRGIDAFGDPFQPLAPSTLRRKKGPGILRETLALQNSYFASHSAKGMRLGNRVPYFSDHLFGDPKRNLPQRATITGELFIEEVLKDILR